MKIKGLQKKGLSGAKASLRKRRFTSKDSVGSAQKRMLVRRGLRVYRSDHKTEDKSILKIYVVSLPEKQKKKNRKGKRVSEEKMGIKNNAEPRWSGYYYGPAQIRKGHHILRLTLPTVAGAIQ